MNDIGWAMDQLRAGRYVTRAEWAGRWIERLSGCIYQRSDQCSMVPYRATQADLMAADWIKAT